MRRQEYTLYDSFFRAVLVVGICFIISFILFLIIGLFASHTVKLLWWLFNIVWFFGSLIATGVLSDANEPYQMTLALVVIPMFLMLATFFSPEPANPGSPEYQINQLQDALQQKEQEIDELKDQWQKDVQSVETENDALKKELYKTKDNAKEQLSKNNIESLQDAQNKLSQLQHELILKLKPAIKQLSAEKDKIKIQLLEMGVKSSVELKDNYQAQTIAGELTEIVQYLNVMNKRKEIYEKACFDLEGLIRRIKRNHLANDAGLSQGEMKNINMMLKSADVRIENDTEITTEFSPVEIDKIIDQEILGAGKNGTK